MTDVSEPKDAPAVAASEALLLLERARVEGRIVELDYPCRPRRRDMSASPSIRNLTERLDSEHDAFCDTLRMMASYAPKLRNIALQLEPEDEPAEPNWLNGWIPGFDAVSLYTLVASRNPAVYLEVGSGNSTKFVRRAIRDHGLRTRIISIDPAPRAEVDRICDEVVRQPLEEADLSLFERLAPGDVVFVDNSHRSFQNSDVTVFFMEVLGRIPPGVVYGLHDIFLPMDYPQAWSDRFYSEQYLLASYLFGGGGGDRIVMPISYAGATPSLVGELDMLWKDPALVGIEPYGGAFWLEKR